MRDSEKSKGQLIKELESLRTRVAQREIRQADDRKPLKAPWGSEEVLSAVFSSVMDGIVVTDLEGRIAEVNDVLVKYSGYSKEEIIGQEAFQLFFNKERDLAKNNWLGLLSPGKVSTKSEYTFLNAQGKKYPVEVNTSVIHDGFGKPFGFVGVIRNITEQKQVEYELKRQYDALQLILDSVPALIYYKDKEGRIVNMNKATASLTNVPKEKLLQKTVSQLLPDTADRYQKDDMEVITSGKAKRNIEEPLELPDVKMWLKTDKLPIKDENGNVIGLIGFSVDITERKKAEEALRNSEEKLRVMFESMTEGVVVADLSGIVVDANKAALKMIGYSAEEVVGRSGLDVIALEDHERAVEGLALSAAGPEIVGIPGFDILTKDGKRISAEVNVNKLSDVDGKPYGFISVIRDMTEKKRAEEALRQSEERYRLIAENMSDVIWIMDLEFRYQYVSPSIERMRGFTVDEAMKMMALDYVSEESLKTATKRLIDELELEKTGGVDPDRVTTVDLEVKNKDGSWMWVEVKVTFLRDNEGKPFGILGVSRDITERRRIQDALRDSEEKLRVIFDSMGDAATVVDMHDNILDCNEAAVKLHGFVSKNGLIGRKASELVAVADRDRAVKDAIVALKKPYISGRSEYKLLTKDGREFEGEFGISVLKDKSGKPAGFIGLAHDISERKRAEEAVRQSEQKLRLMFDSMTDGVVVTDMQFKITDVNEAAVRFSSYSRDELIGQNGLVLLQENDRDRSADIVNEMIQDKRTQEKHEHTFVRTDDAKLDIEVSTSVLRDSSENPVGLINVVRDVTERKLIEGALRKSEEKYRDLVDKERDVIFSVDALGFITSINPAVKGWGYTREEILGKNFIELVPEDWRERTAVDLQNALLASGELTAETMIVHKSGEVMPIEYSAMIIREEGQYAGVRGVVRDVSERKKVEEALRQSEGKFRVLFESIPDGISVIDLKTGKLTDSNPAALRMFGFEKEEIMGREAFNLIAEKDRMKAFADMQNTLVKGCSTMSQWCLLGEGGKEYDCEATAAVINDSSGAPAFMVNVIRDITERKRIEKELDDYRNSLEKMVQERTSELIRANKDLKREIGERQRAEDGLRASEEKLRGIFNSIHDTVALTDLEFTILEVNDAALELSGYKTKEELVGIKGYDFLDPETLASAMSSRDEAVEGRPVPRGEYKMINKLGRELYVDIGVSMYHDPSGKTAGFVAVIKDITEHRRMEDALRDSEEKLRVMFSSMADGVVVTDLQGRITDLNEAQLRMFGYKDKKEIVGTAGFDFIAEQDRERAFKEILKVFEEGYNIGAIYAVVDIKGKEFETELSTAMLHDVAGKPSGLITVMRDVTERRRMEEALRDSEEKLRFMFKSIVDAVVVVDIEGKIMEVNDAGLRLTGYSDKGDLIGINAFDFVVGEDRDRAFTDMMDSFKVGDGFLVQYRFKNKQGDVLFVDARGGMVYNASGDVTGFIIIVRDITERRRMEQALRDSEEKLRIIFESIGDGIVVTDLEGIVAECNESAAKIGGWSDKSKLIGMSGFDFVAEQERGKMVADMIKALTEQLSINVEYSVKNKDGREYQSEVNVTLLRDASGKPKGIVSVIRDITERKRMEQDLRDSEEMSRGMLESAATAVCIVKDGKFQYVSPMFAEMTGYTIDELMGTVSTDHIHQNDRDKVMQEAVANLKGESTAPHEYRLLRKDGSFIWILEKIASIQYKGERAAIGSLLDITRLKQVEEALRDSEEKLQFIFASIPDGVTVTDLNGIVIEQNEAGIKEIGYGSKDEVIGLNGFDFIAESDRSRALVDLPQIFEKGISGPLEYKMLRKDGTEYEGEVTASMMRDKDGNPQGFITVIRNVTERKKAREELKESQEMMRGMLDSAATGIYLVQDGKFEYVNPLFSGISGYAPEELLGSESMSHIHPDDREVARAKAIENLKGISDLPHEFRFIRKDGQSIWILEKVASIEYKGRRAAIGSFMDISERKRIEEILRQRSRELEQRTNQLLALQQITSAIQSTLDLKEILQQVANGVVHNLGFDHALIIKVDEAANVARGMVFATREDTSKVNDLQEIIGRRLTEIEIPQVRGYSQVVDNSLDGKATITHDFFEVASALLTQDESNAAAELLGAKTIVVMPLFARDRHVGSILALTKQEEMGGIFLEPLRILGDQAGFAVENADLYHGVSEYAQRLSVISALSKILGSSLDIKGVYSAFTEEVKKVMKFDRTSIAMVEGDQLRYFVVAEGVDTELKDGAKLPLSDSATGLVVKTKRTIIETDFDQEMKFPIDHMYYRSGLRSAIRVPLFSKGEVFATLNLASTKPNAYGEREREILEQISGSLTAAMENSRLFDQVKQHEAELLKAYEELKSAQAYMVQAEKLRALGEMAGGVAHDFNNILAVVLGRTQLALEDVKDEKLKKDLQIIEQTALDAATTVRRLQDFARVRVERNFEVLDLNEVVKSALQMVESRRVKLKEREGISIDVESKLRDTATVEGDAAELREGLLNIVFNAMDAMPTGGKITVETQMTKEWVIIAISDTGIGIPEEIRTKIFDPFFTTRTHKGTGLGLSVTYSIIQRHRGEITVESTIGVGSTFYIKLPLCEGVVSKKHAAGKADAVKSVSILMVDDNPEVAGILGLTLRRLGHIVVEANSGEAAINTFEVGKFDLVITDLGMPDMSGHEVAKIVKEIKPGTPVLVISGWGGQLNLDEMPEVDGVIAKPFSKDVLSEKISAVLSCEGAKARDLKQKATKAKKTGKSASKSDKSDKGLTGKEEKPKKRKGAGKKE